MRRGPVILVLAAFGLTAATSSRSQTLPECPPEVRAPIYLNVENPCPDRTLKLIVRTCAPCVDLLGWTHEPEMPLQIHASMNEADCMIDICQPETLAIPIGPFRLPGHYSMLVQLLTTVTRADSTQSQCLETRWESVEFDVPTKCPPPSQECPPDVRIPIGLKVFDPCPNTSLYLTAQACGPCVDLQGWTYSSTGMIQILAAMNEADCMNRLCDPKR